MSEISILMGGQKLTVKFVDGTTLEVVVRNIPVYEMERYLAAYNNEPACVDVFCDKPEGWSKTLSRESFEAVIEKGEELNLDFLTRYATRQVARRNKIMPGHEEKVLAQTKEMLEPLMREALAKLLPSLPSKQDGQSPKPSN